MNALCTTDARTPAIDFLSATKLCTQNKKPSRLRCKSNSTHFSTGSRWDFAQRIALFIRGVLPVPIRVRDREEEDEREGQREEGEEGGGEEVVPVSDLEVCLG